MTESQIACFEAVAKHLSFSNAAKQLMISQPAISHQVSKLERELGLLLFDRTGRTIALTEAGLSMLDFFTHARESFAESLRAARANQDVFSGEVLLGCPESWDISPFLSTMVSRFEAEHPKIHVRLVGLPLEKIEESLLAGRIHAGLAMDYSLERREQLSTRHLIGVHSVLLYSRQCPVREDEPVTLAQFKDRVFFLVESDKNPAYRQMVFRECEKHGFVPKIAVCPNVSAALFYVQNNQGVFLGNELMMAKYLEHLYSYLTLEDTQRSIVLVWRSEEPVRKSPLHFFLNEILYNDKLQPCL